MSVKVVIIDELRVRKDIEMSLNEKKILYSKF